MTTFAIQTALGGARKIHTAEVSDGYVRQLGDVRATFSNDSWGIEMLRMTVEALDAAGHTVFDGATGEYLAGKAAR